MEMRSEQQCRYMQAGGRTDMTKLKGSKHFTYQLMHNRAALKEY